MLRNGKAFHRCFGRDKFDHFSIAKLILFRFCVFCSLFRLTLCDCSVSLPRRLSDHSAIPTGDVDSLQIVWQNGDSIWSQKIDRKFCKATGESLLVNRSQSLAFPGNGLAAAVATKAGLAVAWKDTGGLFSTLGEGPVRLDGGSTESISSTSSSSTSSTLVLVETDQGVGVAWSTWQEGWVTHLRRCRAAPLDCGPTFDLRRPNISMPADWLPRMLSCNHGLWALFVDGPYLNFLGYDSWSSGPVVDYRDEVISAALDCVGEEVVSLWIEKNGTVQWRSTSNPPSPPIPPPVPRDNSLNVLNTMRALRTESKGLNAFVSQAQRLFGAFGGPVLAELTQSVSTSTWSTSSKNQKDIGPGEISVLAVNGYMLVVNTWPKLQVQLFNYLHPARYPIHALAPGGQNVEVLMDCAGGECRGTFICWSSGGVFREDASFQCTYRSLMGLMNVDGLGAAGQMVLVVMFSLLFLLCLLKQCSGGGLRRRFFARTEEPAQRREARERVSELRNQLAQIPLVPVQGCEAPSTSPCPICQNEVQIRVALQRCGHTACRDCTTRLVDMAQPCHICRAPIEGLQIVYI